MTTKLATMAALLLLLLAAAVADENQGRYEQCSREEMRLREMLQYCKSYLQSGERYLNQQPPRQCCNQMERVRQDCRCRAVEEMGQEIMQEAEYGGGQSREQVRMRLERLPGECNLRPERCQMRYADQQCEQEMRTSELIRACRDYFQYAVIDTVVGDNQGMPRQCCRKMEQVREECRCRAVEEMGREMMQREGEYGGMSRERTRTRLEGMTGMCGLRPQRCSIRDVSY